MMVTVILVDTQENERGRERASEQASFHACMHARTSTNTSTHNATQRQRQQQKLMLIQDGATVLFFTMSSESGGILSSFTITRTAAPIHVFPYERFKLFTNTRLIKYIF